MTSQALQGGFVGEIGEKLEDDPVYISINQESDRLTAYFALRLDSIGVSSAEEQHSEAYIGRLLDAQIDFIATLPGLGQGGAIELRHAAHPNPCARHCGQIDVSLRVRIPIPAEDAPLQIGLDEHQRLSVAKHHAMSAFQGLYPNLVAIHPSYEWVPVQEESEYHRLFNNDDFSHFAELLRREAQVRLSAIDPLPRNRPIGFSAEPPLFEDAGAEAVHVFAPFVPTLSDLRRLYDIMLLQPSRTVLIIVIRPTVLQPEEVNYLLEQSGRCEHFHQGAVPHTLPLSRQADLLVSQLTDTMFSLRDDCFEMGIQIAGCEPLNASLVEAFGTTITGHVSSRDTFGATTQRRLMQGGYDWNLAKAVLEKESAKVRLNTMVSLDGLNSQAGRLRHLFCAREANCAFRFPLPRTDDFPGLLTRRAIALPPPPSSPVEGIRLGENIHRGIHHPIHQLDDDRRRHTYIVGQTGTGKSSLLRTMILQDIYAGKGVAVFDPHGELVDDILPCIPPDRVKDVYYVSPERPDLAIGINMLEHHNELERDAVINNLLEIFHRLYDAVPESMGPAFEQYFRNAALLEMADPEMPPMLDGILRIFSDADYRESRLKKCQDPIVIAFWNVAIRASGESSLPNFGQYISNKLSRFIYNGILRRILLQPKTTINFSEVIDKGGILLVDLCKGRLGETNTAFLAMALIGQIQRAAFARTSVYDKSRLRDFYLYIDEFQNVATDSFITIMSEARKYRLNAILTNQYIHQIPKDIIEAIRGNVGTVIAFRTGCQDAELLSEEFAPSIGRDDLLNLPNFHAYVSTLTRGEASSPFSLCTQIREFPRSQETVLRIIQGMGRYSISTARADKSVRERWAPPISPGFQRLQPVGEDL